MPMPHTTPPRIWLRAIFGLTTRPAAIALTTRLTLTDAQVLVDQYLDEHRRVSRGGIGFAFLVGLGVHLNLNRLFPAVPCQLGQCHPRLAEGQMPFFENRLLRRSRQRTPADVCRATASSFSFNASQACCTAVPTDETVNDPPCNGAVGNEESPRIKVTSFTATPEACAAICVITV